MEGMEAPAESPPRALLVIEEKASSAGDGGDIASCIQNVEKWVFSSSAWSREPRRRISRRRSSGRLPATKLDPQGRGSDGDTEGT